MLLPVQASALTPNKPPSIQVEKLLTNWLPFVALAVVYAATQFAAKLKVGAVSAQHPSIERLDSALAKASAAAVSNSTRRST